MTCNIFDVACAINDLITWLVGGFNYIVSSIWSIISPFYNLLNGIISLFVSLLSQCMDFLTSLFGLFTSISSFLTGFLFPLINVPEALGLFALILMGVTIIIFIRIWNFIADLQIFGWKLPKLPEI